jgi:hypothetical protein
VVGVRPFPFDELLVMTVTVAYFQPELIVNGVRISSNEKSSKSMAAGFR